MSTFFPAPSVKTMKISTMTHTSTSDWNVNGLLEEVEYRRHFGQLFRQLRFNVVEQGDHRHWVDDLLHGAQRNPHLRPDASEAVRPRTPELFLAQREELGVPSHTGLRRAMFVASAVAVFCLRRAEWCVATATAWAIDSPGSTLSSPSPPLGSSGLGLLAWVHQKR